MKQGLLILTQKVDADDPILGFFHRWIEEFARDVRQVTVICLEEGSHNLPENVRVLSLGKEKLASRLAYVEKFYSYIWKYQREYGAVFVHMNPEYVILGAPVWRLLQKRISLWYVHRQVNLKLRIAEKLSDIIFTSAKESFGIRSPKVRYVGHGIDPDKFPRMQDDGPLSLVHLGRITPIKHIEVIRDAARLLGAPLRLAGSPVTEADKLYETELLKGGKDILVDESNDDARAFPAGAVSVNAAPDGGMDKAVLGSLAALVPAFASNRAFAEVFGEYADIFMYPSGDAAALAGKIKAFLARGDRKEIMEDLSKKVRSEYDVSMLIKKLVALLYA